MLINDDIVAKIKNGGVGVLPTDTVYGLVCSATHLQAVSRLYGLKDRHQKPGTIVAANIDQLIDLGIPPRYLQAVKNYWPNPISIIIPIGPAHYELHQGKMSLALRVPKNEDLQRLLLQTGPLLTTSANQPGEPVPFNISQARHYFGDSVDYYVDGGDLSGNQPSTIIRVVDDAVEVVREGAIRLSDHGELLS